MSQPNYEFGLKYIFVRKEINRALTELRADIERLCQFHEHGPFNRSFKAFDIIYWPSCPSKEIDVLIKESHKFGGELSGLWKKAHYYHDVLKEELEHELFWIRHKTVAESDPGNEQLEDLLVSLFENPERIHLPDYRLLLEKMDTRWGDSPLNVRRYVTKFIGDATCE